MATLFQLNSKNNVILFPSCYELCPDLRMITNEELLYIILAYDYKSPYHQFPIEERRRKASREVWATKDTDHEDKPTVKKAIELYRSLQYDPDRETIINYKRKIELINVQIHDEDSPNKIKGMIETIKLLGQNCEDLQQKIDFGDAMKVELKGKGVKSLIENMQESRELYEMTGKDVMDEMEVNIEYPDYNSERIDSFTQQTEEGNSQP